MPQTRGQRKKFWMASHRTQNHTSTFKMRIDLPDDLWHMVWAHTGSVDDLVAEDPRFLAYPAFQFTEVTGVEWLVSQDVRTVRDLWLDLMRIDLMNSTTSCSPHPSILAYLDQRMHLLTHKDVREKHGVITITMAFCSAHNMRADRVVKNLTPHIPVALFYDPNDKEELEKFLKHGQRFRLILDTGSFMLGEVSCIDFRVTPPVPYSPYCDLTLEPYEAGDPVDPAIDILHLAMVEHSDSEMYANWRFDLTVAPNSTDLQLAVWPCDPWDERVSDSSARTPTLECTESLDSDDSFDGTGSLI